MKPLNLLRLGVRTIWVVTSTFFKHLAQHQHVRSKSEARKDITYDEAFEVVKAFLLQSSYGTVEELQSFCNTYVPSPFYVLTVSVLIPKDVCDQAAQYLIRHTGSAEDCSQQFGGTEWWQKRPRADGALPAEWIAMKKDWNGQDLKRNIKKKRSAPKMNGHLSVPGDRQEEEASGPQSFARYATDEYHKDLDDKPCLFYIHGGGFYFGSLNTHRYSIWRMAKKMNGRAFAVTYRLSPQYPFPAAIQDCLAAYLYLIRPPPDAPHQAIHPTRIVFAGDSAGGSLCLALLNILRDLDLPLPSGACLISPWCDLTESFPSIMTNVKTDVIPPYGFIHRPSTLWPPLQPEAQERVNSDMIESLHERVPHLFRRLYPNIDVEKHTQSTSTKTALPSSAIPTRQITREEESGPSNLGDSAEPSDFIQLSIDGEKVELKDQIHLYALNSQLDNPLVSAVLAPTLAGLPPLLIMAGDKEVLRDEIIYLAHRAANPDRFPLRSSLQAKFSNHKWKDKFKDAPPTQVHLQVYEGLCHDVTLFAFIPPARYAYRAIASFCRAVTTEKFDIISPTKSPQNSLDSTTIKDQLPNRLAKEISRTIYTGEFPSHRPEFVNNMIRERISVRGVVTALEPMEELAACQVDSERIGLIHAEPAKRYLQGRLLWDRKFKNATAAVEKARRREVQRAIRDEEARMKAFAEANPDQNSEFVRVWHLHGEKPPPSSRALRLSKNTHKLLMQLDELVAARKDTAEARRLAQMVVEQHSTSEYPLRIWQKVQDLWWKPHDRSTTVLDDASSISGQGMNEGA